MGQFQIFWRANNHTLTAPVRNPRISTRDICPQDRRSAAEYAFDGADQGTYSDVGKEAIVNPASGVAGNQPEVAPRHRRPGGLHPTQLREEDPTAGIAVSDWLLY